MGVLIFSCLAILLAFDVSAFSNDLSLNEIHLVSKNCVAECKRKRKERDYELPVTVLKRANIDSVVELFGEERRFKSLNDLDTVAEGTGAVSDWVDTIAEGMDFKSDGSLKLDDISPKTIAFSPSDIDAAVQSKTVPIDLLVIADQGHAMNAVPGVSVKKVTFAVPGEKEDCDDFVAVKDYDEGLGEEEEEDLMEAMKKFSIGLSDSRVQENLNPGIDIDPELED